MTLELNFVQLKKLYSKKFTDEYWNYINNNLNNNFSNNDILLFEKQIYDINRWKEYNNKLKYPEFVPIDMLIKRRNKFNKEFKLKYSIKTLKYIYMKEHIKKDIYINLVYRLLCKINDDKNINEIICMIL